MKGQKSRKKRQPSQKLKGGKRVGVSHYCFRKKKVSSETGKVLKYNVIKKNKCHVYKKQRGDPDQMNRVINLLKKSHKGGKNLLR